MSINEKSLVNNEYDNVSLYYLVDNCENSPLPNEANKQPKQNDKEPNISSSKILMSGCIIGVIFYISALFMDIFGSRLRQVLTNHEAMKMDTTEMVVFGLFVFSWCCLTFILMLLTLGSCFSLPLKEEMNSFISSAAGKGNGINNESLILFWKVDWRYVLGICVGTSASAAIIFFGFGNYKEEAIRTLIFNLSMTLALYVLFTTVSYLLAVNLISSTPEDEDSRENDDSESNMLLLV